MGPANRAWLIRGFFQFIGSTERTKTQFVSGCPKMRILKVFWMNRRAKKIICGWTKWLIVPEIKHYKYLSEAGTLFSVLKAKNLILKIQTFNCSVILSAIFKVLFFWPVQPGNVGHKLELIFVDQCQHFPGKIYSHKCHPSAQPETMMLPASNLYNRCDSLMTCNC